MEVFTFPRKNVQLKAHFIIITDIKYTHQRHVTPQHSLYQITENSTGYTFVIYLDINTPQDNKDVRATNDK